jgi:hypothetical protein
LLPRRGGGLASRGDGESVPQEGLDLPRYTARLVSDAARIRVGIENQPGQDRKRGKIARSFDESRQERGGRLRDVR